MGRLTHRTENGWVEVNDQTNGVVSTNSQAVHRLADLEDILEKYGIESVEELDKRLMKIHNEWCCQEADLLKTEIDRDTWKKACELAGERVGKLLKDNCPYELCFDCEFIEHCMKLTDCNTNKEMECNEVIADYFYQQAQKEI